MDDRIYNATARISVLRQSSLAVAPKAVAFQITDLSGFEARGPRNGEVYDPRLHDLHYFWDFGDSDIYVAPESVYDGNARHPGGHRNSQYAYGPWAAHTFRRPGRYTVSCVITEPETGRVARAEHIVDVDDPEKVFAKRGTVFVSAGRDMRYAPEGAVLTSSLDDALRGIAGQENLPRRIILNRGEEHTFSSAVLGHGVHWPSLHIIAGPGSGAAPVVRCAGGMYWHDTATQKNGESKDLVIQNITWLGPYDSTRNSGDAVVLFAFDSNSPALFLLDGCFISGFGNATFGGPKFACYNDTTITNWYNSGINDYGKQVTAITGCSIRSADHALVDSTDALGTPYRGDEGLTIFHSSEIFSRQGWSPYGEGLAVQPCLRLNAEGVEGGRALVVACTLEGGHKVLQAQISGVGQPHRSNMIFEKNYLLGGYQTYNILAISQAGATIRNNIMVYPDVGYDGWNGPISFVAAEYLGGDSANRDAPINVYSNTFVNLTQGRGPAVLISLFWGNEDFTNVTLSNNVEHQPETSPVVAKDAPLADTHNMWPPRERGYATSRQERDVDDATPHGVISVDPTVGFSVGSILTNGQAQAEIVAIADDGSTLALGAVRGGSFAQGDSLREVNATGKGLAITPLLQSGVTASFAPLLGSSALGDAVVGRVAHDDFFGSTRPQYPSRGAFEAP